MRKKIFIFTILILLMFVSANSAFAETYDNMNTDVVVSCGNGMIDERPSIIPKVVRIAYTLIHVAVPVVLVILGSLDLFKGITVQKEDDIKKGQQMFIKRLISAASRSFLLIFSAIVRFWKKSRFPIN